MLSSGFDRVLRQVGAEVGVQLLHELNHLVDRVGNGRIRFRMATATGRWPVVDVADVDPRGLEQLPQLQDLVDGLIVS